MSMRSASLGFCLVGISLATGLPVAAQDMPYAGQQNREVSSFSEQDIEDLMEGRGWGLAKPAELNGWPGPAHVIELADELGLSAGQREKIDRIFEAMNAAAREAGEKLIEAEAALDAAFESGQITVESLQAHLSFAEAARTRLRLVHLSAHLELGPILNMHQKMLYDRARGYAGDAAHSEHGGHK